MNKQVDYADPWRDIDIIDKRAVRFSQGTTALLAFLGIIISPWFWLLMSVQLLLGLLLGRRWCLPCLFYYHLIQPRFGQGELEDSRPPRFANIIGFSFLLLAFLLSFFSMPAASALALLVFLLATLAATTGFCLGCTAYRSLAHLRGIRSWKGHRLDVNDFSSGNELVIFSHPLCLECQIWKEQHPEADIIDVSKNKDLAHKYGILLVPTVYRVDKDGIIQEQLAP